MGTESIADVLFTMRRNGVRLWIEDGRLRYQAPKGVLSPQDIDALRHLGPSIAALLSQPASSTHCEPKLAPRLPSDRVPLTQTQRGWFGTLEQKGSYSIRGGWAFRLTGRLNVPALRESLQQLVRRHESLRTRIIKEDGIPWQIIDRDREHHLEFIDLGDKSVDDAERSAERLAKQLVNERIDLAVGPMFASRLIKLESYHHVLVLAIDHLIYDAVTLGLLWKDTWELYEQHVRGLTSSLPPIYIQFPDYAVWQQRMLSVWIAKERNYWHTRLAGAQPVRLTMDEDLARGNRPLWSTVPLRFDERTASALRELSRCEKTTLAISVLAAYVALVFRWCNTDDLVIATGSRGRFHPEVENTVGFFASPVILRLSIGKDDSLRDLLRHVRDEYSAAYEHAESCIVLSDMVDSGVAPVLSLNWIPQELTSSREYILNPDVDSPDAVIRQQPFLFDKDSYAFDDIDIDTQPTPMLSDSADGITGYIWYRKNRSMPTTIKRLERNFCYFAEKLATEPGARVAALSCVG